MKLKQLNKKYPKAFNKCFSSGGFFIEDDVRDYWREITDFMDKHKIVIESRHFGNATIKENYFSYINIGVNTELAGFGRYRKTSETKAIDKAFEILEKSEEN